MDNVKEKYINIANEIANLVYNKQLAYGDSFGKSGQIMKILYPNGITHEQMDDALAVVRIIDKLFRICSDRGAFGEDPAKDLIGYGILMATKKAEEDKNIS